jgi:Domain of unknown function (DUF3472)/Domain of unknown function (DUF5077)/FKBP-type peptidyl-prolyl cis-trans isomerase
MKSNLLYTALLSFSVAFSFAQQGTQFRIPGNTGYLIPAEKESEDFFSEKQGLINWGGQQNQHLYYFFHVTKPGNFSVQIRALQPGVTITASVGLTRKTSRLQASRKLTTYALGDFRAEKPGFYALVLTCANKTAGKVRIQEIIINGKPAEGMHANKQPRRNAASVHLRYPFPDSVKAIGFYNEITIPEGADHLHSYYMACGFSRGYFGIQVNSPTERRVIFSVWDAGNEAIDREKVKEEDKVKLEGRGTDVVAEDFGNEGTGGHSHWVYPWKTGVTYRFYTTALPDSASNSTIYTGYFFIPELQQWKLIASFKAPKDGKHLRSLYSFVENFWGNNGQLYRKAQFDNQWLRRDNGQWVELTESRFSYDVTGKAGDRIDHGGGTAGKGFYLWNGGFREADARFNDTFTRVAGNQKPVVDLFKNADSLTEAGWQRSQIMDYIRAGKTDTTGSKDGVWYKLLREGNGRQVTVNDTVTVHYKGMLLNGSVFDETKEKPATFPLKRLIRGWQVGVPFLRVGGKIRLLIPSALGYGIRSLGIIPPNSVLIFEIEVLEAKGN